jgi:hypothetical protein
MDLKESELLGDAVGRHFYYAAKGAALRKLLGGKPANQVLDVGAGSGVFTRQLLDAHLAESALCVDVGYPRDWTETHGGKPIHFVREARPGRQNDLLLMMDVLEHVDDDQSLLRQYTSDLPEHARVVITVPAFQWMWSGHDVFLEHRRRYTLSQLEALVRRGGLEVETGCYFFGALFPALAITRVWNRLASPDRSPGPRNELRQYPSWLNGVLTQIHGLERRTIFPANRWAGLTVFCLARPAAGGTGRPAFVPA